MIIVIFFFFFSFLSFLPLLVSFLPPPFQRDRAGQREKKARLPLKLASEHEAWILSFFPAKYALHFSPTCPISGVGRGGFPRTGVRPRQGDRAQRIPTQSCTPHWVPTHSGISDPTPSSLLPKRRVAVCVWSECEWGHTPVCVCVCVCVTRWKPGVHLSFPSYYSVNSPLLAAFKQKGENKTQEVFDLSSCRIKHVP